MEYRLRNSADTLGCRLCAEKGFRFCGEMPRDYEPETVAYAACRLIRHSVPVKDRLVREAVRRGLNTGKEGRPVRREVRTTADRLSLPGRNALISVLVTQGAVTVKEVRVF